MDNPALAIGYLLLGVFALGAVYVLVRLVFYAIFKSYFDVKGQFQHLKQRLKGGNDEDRETGNGGVN